MSYQLPREKRLAVLAGLVDGNSESAVERMTDEIGLGVTQKTIGLFALRMGTAAQWLHNTQAHDLSISLIENDEIWSYCKKKQARVTPEEHAAGFGEQYSFVALGMPSRYVVTWVVGKRDQSTSDAFIADLRARLIVMPAMTSDGFAPYVSSIGASFGPGVDYGQTIKNYRKGGRRDDDHRYEPPREAFVTKKAIFGAPDMEHATTAHIERNNGTMRHFIGRMRRLVYAFSKKPENHRAAVALGYVHYNLCHCLKTKGMMNKITPAMAAGVTDHVWELGELLDALLSVPETGTPEKKPLAPRKPAGPSRELPGGRGFLRIVPKGNGPQAPPPAPAPAPAVPAVAVAAAGVPVAPPRPEASPTAAPAPVDDRQLDLFSWKPRPKPSAQRIEATPGQLSLLFGLDLEPEK